MSALSRHRLFDGTTIPARILGGPGCRKALASQVDELGLRRILVVAGPTLRAKTPFVDELRRSLGERVVGVYDRVKGHTPIEATQEAAEAAREMAPDAVLSIGGGSVHDAAKAIAVMVPSGRSIVDFVSRFEPPAGFYSPYIDVTPLPVITMPSTLSAADVVGGGAVTDTARGQKLIFVHPKLTPVVVVLDAEILASTPRHIVASSGMNALHHCLEALYSKGHQPITDALALRALEGLVSILPAFAPGRSEISLEVFQEALDAAALSGLTYANSWLGIGHAVCHSLGGRYGLSHGESNAVMIRHSLRFNLEVAADRLKLAARAVGACFPPQHDALAGRHMVALVDWLAEELQVPQTLRELGLPEGQFETIADDVLADPQSYWNPRSVTRAEVVRLLEQAW